MKSWYIGTAIVGVIIVSIFMFSGLNSTIAALLMFALFPSLVYWGWTLKERSIYRNEQLEQKVMQRLRRSKDGV
jgi:hypothetical protein